MFAARQPHWIAYMEKRYDRKTGQWKYKDWDEILRGVQEPMKGNGESELERHTRAKRHVKPNQEKQRRKDRKIYYKDVKKVEDLLKYVQFMKDHPKDFPEARSSQDRKKE